MGNKWGMRLLILFFIISIISSASAISLPYNQKYNLQYSNVTLELNQEEPPLYVDFQVTPQMIVDYKVVYKNKNDMVGKTYRIERPDEYSRFVITITNESGEILAQEGYGGIYDSSTDKRTIAIRYPGPYIVELYGQKVDVSISIDSPKAIPQVSTQKYTIPEGYTNTIYNEQVSPLQDITHKIYSFASYLRTVILYESIFAIGMIIFSIIIGSIIRAYYRLFQNNSKLKRILPKYKRSERLKIKKRKKELKISNKKLAVNENNADIWNEKGLIYLELAKSELNLVYAYLYSKRIFFNGRSKSKIEILFKLLNEHKTESLKAFEQSKALNPDNPSLLCNMSLYYCDMGEYDTALEYIDEVLDNDENNSVAWCNKGIILEKLRNFKESKSALEKSISLNNKSKEAYIALSKIAYHTGDLKAIGDMVDKLSKLDPNCACFYQLKAEYLSLKYIKPHKIGAMLGDYKINGECYKKYLECDKLLYKYLKIKPFDYKQWYNKSIINLDINRLHKASINVNVAMSLAKEKNADLLSLKGIILYDKRRFYNINRYEEVLSCYKEALEINQNSFPANYNLGILYYDLHEYDKAIETFEIAYQIMRTIKILNYRGKALLALQKYNEALKLWDEGLELSRNNSNLLAKKGYTLYKLRKYTDALNIYNILISRCPNNIIPHKYMRVLFISTHRYGKALSCHMKIMSIWMYKIKMKWKSVRKSGFIKYMIEKILCYVFDNPIDKSIDNQS